MDFVIFAIDNDGDLHQNSRFHRMVDELSAMNKLHGTMKFAIGSYKGQLERSYIMDKRDFDSHILHSGYVDKQESFLVARDGYYGVVYATLEYQSGEKVALGQLVEVDPEEALASEAWTYRPDVNTYWVTKK